jgi:amidase
VLNVMDNTRVDALVYPSWNNLPRPIGDLNSPHGSNSEQATRHRRPPASTPPLP